MRRADEMPEEEYVGGGVESPFSNDWQPVFEPREWGMQAREPRTPDTPIQALMEARPFDEVPQSKLEKLAIRDEIADAIDELTERERWIFEAHHYRGLSMRQIEQELSLSKTQVHRLLAAVTAKLQLKLAHLIGE